VLSAESIEIRQRLKTDFAHYSDKCLRIRTKSGVTAPLAMNRSQRYLHERLEAQRTKTGKVRALVLKGRQVGISTYIGGRFYWRVSHGFGLRAFILTHLDDATANLFTMAKRFHENCPAVVRPETSAANAKELNFHQLDSGYNVATAGNKSVGRSATIQLMHGSEVAFWPNAEEHFAGVMQAVAGTPGTEVLLESTANGIGNVFYKLWKRAERGDSDFEAVFIPWFWHEEYAANCEGSWRAPEAWADYAQWHGLTREQLWWAFCKNRDLIVQAGGEADAPSAKFKQEYPGTAAEAFETSGENAFIDPLKVLKARKSNVQGYGPIILGVDPARGGRAKTALIDRQGRRSGKHVFRKVDFGENTMAIAGEIVRERHRLKSIHPKVKIAIDTTGLGGPIYDRLCEMLPTDELEPVNFGSEAHNRERFANRRAEMHDRKRAWYDDPAGVQVPDNDEFQGEECSLVRGPGATHFRSNGQLIMESKEHVEERLGITPDWSDAHALTFSVDMEALHTQPRRDYERHDSPSGWAV